MTLENNLYLQSMTAVQTKSMLKKKGYSPAPDLEVGLFEKNYEATLTYKAWLGRKIRAIPYAAFDVTIRSVYDLFAAFGYTLLTLISFAEWEDAAQKFYHIGRNFQIAAGRLYGLFWDDCAGLKIVDRTSLNKRCGDISNRYASSYESRFFYECAMSQLSSLRDAKGPSLENLVSYLEAAHENVNTRKEQITFILEFLNRLFKDEIFGHYSKERLVEAYKKLIVKIHEMQFGSQVFNDKIIIEEENPFQNTLIRTEKGLLEGFRKNIFRCHDQKDAQEIFLEVCQNILKPKFEEFMSKKFVKNIYLAHEYFLQRKEKELIEILSKNPEVVFYQGKCEKGMTAEMISKKPELFPQIFFKAVMLPQRGYWCDKLQEFSYTFSNRYPCNVGEQLFVKFLLMINPNLLNISSEGCESEFLKDLLENKKEAKTKIQIAIDEIKSPEFTFDNVKIDFRDYLEEFWFVKGLIKLNPKIFNFVDTNEKIKKAFLKSMSNEKQLIFNMLCTLLVASKEKKLKLPKYLSRYILTFTF